MSARRTLSFGDRTTWTMDEQGQVEVSNGERRIVVQRADLCDLLNFLLQAPQIFAPSITEDDIDWLCMMAKGAAELPELEDDPQRAVRLRGPLLLMLDREKRRRL